MKVFIYAYEGQYEGLHGMYEAHVCDVDSLEEAEDLGQSYAEDVIDDYSWVWEDENEDDIGFEHELGYEIYRIKDETINIDELNACVFELGVEDFINQYCGEELA